MVLRPTRMSRGMTTLPLKPTLTGCPMFAPAYVGLPRRGEALQRSVFLSFPSPLARIIRETPGRGVLIGQVGAKVVSAAF